MTGHSTCRSNVRPTALAQPFAIDRRSHRAARGASARRTPRWCTTTRDDHFGDARRAGRPRGRGAAARRRAAAVAWSRSAAPTRSTTRSCSSAALRAGAAVAPIPQSTAPGGARRDGRRLGRDATCSSTTAVRACAGAASRARCSAHAWSRSTAVPAATPSLAAGSRGAPSRPHRRRSSSRTWPFNVIYSSGTTGTPKGIVQPHAMRWTHVQRASTYGYGPAAVTLVSTPLHSNTTLVSFFPALALGGTVVLMAQVRRRALSRAGRATSRDAHDARAGAVPAHPRAPGFRPPRPSRVSRQVLHQRAVSVGAQGRRARALAGRAHRVLRHDRRRRHVRAASRHEHPRQAAHRRPARAGPRHPRDRRGRARAAARRGRARSSATRPA